MSATNRQIVAEARDDARVPRYEGPSSTAYPEGHLA